MVSFFGVVAATVRGWRKKPTDVAARLRWCFHAASHGRDSKIGGLVMNRMILPAVPVLALLIVTPVAAEMFGSDYTPCGNQPNTLAMVDCVDAKMKTWDQRLNVAYKNLMQRIDAGQRDPLKAAQRLWIQYRDANCRFYGSQEGSIRQIQAAECLRAMTQDRTLELEKAMKFD